MISALVDTNIFIDVLGPATDHRRWSLKALAKCLDEGGLVLSPIVWAELAASPLAESVLSSALAWLGLKREAVSFEAAFVAGKAHRQYRMAGGQRDRTLPDFFIGAHASVGKHRLLTRDPARYASYFPEVELISPATFP